MHAKHCRERFARQGSPVRASDACSSVDRPADRGNFRLRATARPWRAGAGAGDFGRRAERDLRQLRFDRDPLVADARCGRAGASLPCRRRQRGRAGSRDGRTATAGADGRIAIWTPGKAEPDAVLEGHTAPIVALAASPDGTTLASASVGSHDTAVAARGRRAARARRAYAERQRRGVRRRRPDRVGQRQL